MATGEDYVVKVRNKPVFIHGKLHPTPFISRSSEC